MPAIMTGAAIGASLLILAIWIEMRERRPARPSPTTPFRG